MKRELRGVTALIRSPGERPIRGAMVLLRLLRRARPYVHDATQRTGGADIAADLLAEIDDALGEDPT